MNIDINTLGKWSEPVRLTTRFGEKLLRKAEVTEQFRQLWRTQKQVLKEAGLGWEVKDGAFTGQMLWWANPTAADLEADKVADAESRATDADIEVPVPAGLELLGYQKAGIKFALARPSTLIADEMGLGKTIQAIGLVNASPELKRILVVCPASLKLNWAREFARWNTRGLKCEIVNGKGWIEGDVTIINYDVLVKHEDALMARRWDLLIVDEAHYAKNAQAQRTAVTHSIPAFRRIYLTGTPVLNRPFEIYPLLSALDPVKWGAMDYSQKFPFKSKEFWHFAKHFCSAFKSRYGWDFSGASNLAQLQKELRGTLMVRRLKKDVLTELPPKRRQIMEITDDGARRVVAAEMAAWNAEEEKIAVARAQVALAKASDDKAEYEAAVKTLRDVVSAAFTQMSRLRHETALAKVGAVIDYVSGQLQDGDNKIVVFAHHTDVVEKLMDGLAAFGPVKLVGGMSTSAKQASVDKFMTQANCRVFVGNIQAAGVGITLVASSTVVFAELDWVPANISQAEDRCHRIGQRDNVLVQHLVLENSLDARMANMIVDKQRIADAALDKLPESQRGAVLAAAGQISVFEPTEVESTSSGTKAPEIGPELAGLALTAMQLLAGVCDWANALDGAGFNKFDAEIGHSLAGKASLSPKQAALALRLARKYRRQLPSELVEQLGVGAKK
jgi:SNF2 family DNA or RNA helicase